MNQQKLIFAIIFMIVGSFMNIALALEQKEAQVFTTTKSIEIDGKLTESAWDEAIPITNFERFLPDHGGPPPGNTEVRFLQDDRNLYIGIVVTGMDYPIRARISPREDINDDDQIGLYIDTVGDARSGYIFYFNAHGIQQDMRFSNGRWYGTFDTIMWSEGTITEDGFVLEIAMPFRSLQYPEKDPANWQIMITRKIPHYGSKYGWPNLVRSHPQMFSQAAPLSNIAPGRAGLGIDIQPSFSAIGQREESNGTMQWEENELLNGTLRPSLDLRYAPTAAIGLTAAINPDFSQIEADVLQFDLNQRFAFYYPERRSFFLDNQEYFSDAANSLYTRSIVDPMFGFKIFQQNVPYSISALQSIDRSPSASVHSLGTPGFNDMENKRTSNTYLRARNDVGESGAIGLFVAQKSVLNSQVSIEENNELRASNSVFGADLSLPTAEIWSFKSALSASHSQGENEQLMGSEGTFSVDRRPPLGWGGSISGDFTTNDHREEMGFLTNSGKQSLFTTVNHTNIDAQEQVHEAGLMAGINNENIGNQWLFSGLNYMFKQPGIFKFFLYAGPEKIQFQQVSIVGYQVEGGFNHSPNQFLAWSMWGKHVKDIDYATLSEAYSAQGKINVSLRPSQRLTLNGDVKHQWFQPLGSELTEATLLFAKASWQITRTLGFRLLYQSNKVHLTETTHNTSALLRWYRTPGREGYLGTTWDLDSTGQRTQGVFAKYTHRFQL